MDQDEIKLIKKIRSSSVTRDQLIQLFYQYRKNYRITLNLISSPKFPVNHSLDVISRLYTMDLVRLIKNMDANPFIRQKAELEFLAKYSRISLGEKIGYLKISPESLLKKLLKEDDLTALEAIINSLNCTENVILEFINRKQHKFNFYGVLLNTPWIKNARVIEAILHDREAPVRIFVAIVPFLNKKKMMEICKNGYVHPSVKKYIKSFLGTKRTKNNGSI